MEKKKELTNSFNILFKKFKQKIITRKEFLFESEKIIKELEKIGKLNRKEKTSILMFKKIMRMYKLFNK